MNVRRTILAATLSGVMLAVGLGVGTIASASILTTVGDSNSTEGVAVSQPLEAFPLNAAGQTYGSAAGVEWEAIPDLVLVIMDNGREGYVQRDLVFPPPASSLAEAVDTRAAVGRINATAEDGKTVIGTFTLDPGGTSEG